MPGREQSAQLRYRESTGQANGGLADTPPSVSIEQDSAAIVTLRPDCVSMVPLPTLHLSFRETGVILEQTGAPKGGAVRKMYRAQALSASCLSREYPCDLCC